ncbi:MAG: polysaccharide biosynthesis protein [Rhodocyclaceae bacterium]|nr:polysaccharide biosynthesis protein [Rhodocyclaceae bacterium]
MLCGDKGGADTLGEKNVLRFNGEIPPNYVGQVIFGGLLLAGGELLVFRFCGLYLGLWRFASLTDLVRILRAAGISAVMIAVAALLVEPQPPLPRMVWLLYPLLMVLGMSSGRLALRLYRERRELNELGHMGEPVFVIGIDHNAVHMIRQLRHSREWHVVGLLDCADATVRNREIMGVRVLGSCHEIAHWARALAVRHVIILSGQLSGQQRRRVIDLCLQANLQVFAPPPMSEVLARAASPTSLRKLQLEDLLGRDAVEIDASRIGGMIAGRVVMVTGAGGSIGAELCRQIASFGPARIVAFELNEFALYTLREEFAEHFPAANLTAVAGDVKDAVRVTEVLERFAPSVLFHAAAYKHVPLMEESNAWQAVRNNVLGTLVVAEAALRCAVERFVLVSTDKAVNPTNVMGASKRLAELLCQCLHGARTARQKTRFEVVRFGNVLGSAGSVVPKFLRQIERGGPVTVTHPEITRFFMVTHEAVQLVMQAAAMGEGGEIFVLDMGEPVRVQDLARDMIRLSGHTEDEIPIVFSGLRPGEKLYEEVLADSEKTLPTYHEKLRIARTPLPEDFDLAELRRWLQAGQARGDDEVRRDLRRWVAEYQPYNPPRPSLVKPLATARAASGN